MKGIMLNDLGVAVMAELDERGVAQGVIATTPEMLSMLQKMLTDVADVLLSKDPDAMRPTARILDAAALCGAAIKDLDST